MIIRDNAEPWKGDRGITFGTEEATALGAIEPEMFTLSCTPLEATKSRAAADIGLFSNSSTIGSAPEC
jgi:hypothetical protein